ncbi:MAG: gliding motility lipoprotein GldH [Bacteroidia bacterium]
MREKVYLLTIFFVILTISSCDKNRLFEENQKVAESGWYYADKMVFKVSVEDISKPYNLYINTRIANDFKYSNVFFLLTQTNPDKTTETQRSEIILANESGKWLGNGVGNVFEYRQPVKQNFKFPEAGIYQFELEQNMRDDTLMHIVSAGIRVELALP